MPGSTPHLTLYRLQVYIRNFATSNYATVLLLIHFHVTFIGCRSRTLFDFSRRSSSFVFWFFLLRGLLALISPFKLIDYGKCFCIYRVIGHAFIKWLFRFLVPYFSGRCHLIYHTVMAMILQKNIHFFFTGSCLAIKMRRLGVPPRRAFDHYRWRFLFDAILLIKWLNQLKPTNRLFWRFELIQLFVIVFDLPGKVILALKCLQFHIVR